MRESGNVRPGPERGDDRTWNQLDSKIWNLEGVVERVLTGEELDRPEAHAILNCSDARLVDSLPRLCKCARRPSGAA
jgi:hypothetical protein